MATQDVSVQTQAGKITFLCILKNEKERIYQIVDSMGNQNPQSIQWNDGKAIKIFGYNGLRIDGNDVYTFTNFSTESYKLGTLA